MSSHSVLHVVWSGDLGGTERHVSWLVRAVPSDSEWTHHVCFLQGGGIIGSALCSEGRATVLNVRGGWDVGGFVAFARLLRRMRPAVVHFHTRNLAAHLTARLAHPSGRRVYTEHAPGALAREMRFRLFYLLFRRSTHAFVAIAPAMVECINGYGVPLDRIALVPHAVSVPLRDPKDVPAQAGWRVGMVARLERQKRVDLFLQIVATLRARGHDASGVVVGSGTERRRLEEMSVDLGLADIVDFTGAQDDVTPWLDGMDALMMTSESEPLGLVALEAMARGVPVVALPCPGGLPALVSEGGRLVSSRDLDAAADALEEVLLDGSVRAEYRDSGFRVARGRTITDVLARLDAVYRTDAPDGSSPRRELHAR